MLLTVTMVGGWGGGGGLGGSRAPHDPPDIEYIPGLVLAGDYKFQNPVVRSVSTG